MFLCNECRVFKVRDACGKDGRGRTSFKDDKGRAWNGRICPGCKNAGAPRPKTLAKTLKKCRRCKGKVCESSYWYCTRHLKASRLLGYYDMNSDYGWHY